MTKEYLCNIIKYTMEKRGTRGFTLIELLIVIAVITILVSIIVPNFRGMQEQGDIIAAQGDLNTLKTGVESYYLNNDRVYPADLTALLSSSPRIITVLPKDRFSKTFYNYQLIEDNNYYIIWSNGPNKTKDHQTQGTPPEIAKTSLKDDILATNLPLVEK